MRQVFIIAIFSLLTIRTSCQSFGEVGTEWYYSENAGGNCPGNCEFVHYKSVKDSLIQGKTTHKITGTYFQRNKDTTEFSPLFVFQQSDTVYRYSFSDTTFKRFYIFNASAGDTLTLDAPPSPSNHDTTYRLVIDSVNLITIDGIPLKKYYSRGLDEYTFYRKGTFTDRIGGMDWLSPRGVMIPEMGGPIRCYKDAQIDTNFQSVNCEHISLVSIPDYNSSPQLILYPNPSDDFLFLESEITPESIEIYNVQGQLLKTTNRTKISVTTLDRGTYWINIIFEGGIRKTKVFIKGN